MNTFVPLPARHTLIDALNTGKYGCELAVCASGLFIMIVQDRYELGGGYGVQVIALNKLINKHCDTIEQVEQYLSKTAPYKNGSAVWVLLPAYNSGVMETDYLKKVSE